MSAKSFGYDIKSVAANYTKYRPLWQPALYEKIYSYLDNGSPPGKWRRELAVDVGCGPGQSTLELCNPFKSVIGIDSSEAQLNEARQFCSCYHNVVFKLGSAETMSSVFAKESVDLVTAGAALHWFDLSTFFEECLRVLKPGGVLAAFCWSFPNWDNEQAHEIIHNQIFWKILKPYWQPGVYHIVDDYKEQFSTMRLNFEDTVRDDDSFKFEFHFSLHEVFGLIKSFPQYHYYKADHPEHPDEIDKALEKLTTIFGTNSMDAKVANSTSRIHLLLGRKKPSM